MRSYKQKRPSPFRVLHVAPKFVCQQASHKEAKKARLQNSLSPAAEMTAGQQVPRKVGKMHTTRKTCASSSSSGQRVCLQGMPSITVKSRKKSVPNLFRARDPCLVSCLKSAALIFRTNNLPLRFPSGKHPAGSPLLVLRIGDSGPPFSEINFDRRKCRNQSSNALSQFTSAGKDQRTSQPTQGR